MKNSIIYISALISLVLFGSCNKQLSLKPTDVILSEDALKNMDDLKAAMFGVYAANTAALNKIYIASILADETNVGGGNRGQGLPTFKWQYTSEEDVHNADFATYYSMINGINEILLVIDAIPTNSSTDVSNKKRIKAELTALRGIAHYEVLTRFMSAGYDPNGLGVPIMLQPSLTAQPARATVGDVITQVKTDLTVGRNESTIPNAPDDITRLSQATIAAYQARIGLLTRNWADAITYAKQAKLLSGAPLATGNDFFDYWADINEMESLWNYHNTYAQGYWYDTNGDVFFNPSNKLVNDYDQNNDIRFYAFCVNAAGTALSISKYPGSSEGPQINDLKLVRSAELYLNLAEAYAHQNNLDSAQAYLDTLRAARINGYSSVPFTGQADAISQVIDERFKEFCFEGYRFFDLKRNSLPIQRESDDVQSPNWQTMPANSYLFAMPIPQHEMFSNKNMVQNPNY